MTYQVDLCKELYLMSSIEEAIAAFEELCSVSLEDSGANAYRLQIQDADEQTKDELLNYILEGSI